jgi:transketolase
MKKINKLKLASLKKKSIELRQQIIEYTKLKSSFLGSCFSCLELIIYLYNHFLKINNKNIYQKKRDTFILSKGHAAPALYAVLQDLKIIDHKLFLSNKTYWHPEKSIKGIDFQTGALGHGLSIGVGIAKYYKINRINKWVVVMIGDGELNEGSIWESFLISKNWKLGNLIIIIDKNKFQANDKTQKILNLGNLKKKILSFDLNLFELNGHSYTDINKKFSNLKKDGTPKVIIARTKRNFGISSIQNKKEFWYVDKNEKKLKQFKIRL